MTLDDKELMGRYIYQVIRRLSRAQRDEVRMELEELISDMYADKGSMETVLTQLGDPAEFAKQYQKRKYSQGDSQSDIEPKVTDGTIEDDKKKCWLTNNFLCIEEVIKRHDFSWNKFLIWFQYILIPSVLIWYLVLS